MSPYAIDLSGKVALVTGGSRGIGRAIALTLAKAGADVAVNYVRHREAAEQTAAAIREEGRRALAIRANVAELEDIDQMFQTLREEFGRLDILVSNAASGVLKPFLDLTMKHWRYTVDINAGTLIPLTQRAVPLMRAGWGRIVAVSSLGATRAIPYYTLVGASKAALESLVRHLAVELAPRGILVNAVSAGVVETDALRHFPNREALLQASLERTPAGRLTTPEDVAEVVLFLCSELARMVVGQTIVVDGGYSILA
jgi:enoyl-[acyl-carrier protein] reductase III